MNTGIETGMITGRDGGSIFWTIGPVSGSVTLLFRVFG
jgi:hypothetical protein